MITEKLTRRKKVLLLTIAVAYFVIGFFSLVVFLGYAVGANEAGIISLLYLVAGWYVLIRKDGIFRLMRIKHD